MLQITEILYNSGDVTKADLKLLIEKEQVVPAAVQYYIRRYDKQARFEFEDAGIIQYYFNEEEKEKNYLQLKFCVAGNMYCTDKNCNYCKMGNFKQCEDSFDCLDILQVHFTADQLSQFIKQKGYKSLSDNVLNFKHKNSFSKQVPVCIKTKNIIEGLVNHPYHGSLENIYVNAQLHMLLLLSLDNVCHDTATILPECRFLHNTEDRAKLVQAKELLIQHIFDPITIKELSRKVAMNECYLKKGFKEMYGTTIFDFYQNQRMEHAKYLLYEKGISVTEVAMMLSYSSISHFSTAFKKHTGLKPCELLLR
ncbi:MAG: helix-turn-helix domain-containing protein [Niabella sp.]